MATMETGLANGVSFALTDEQKELRASRARSPRRRSGRRRRSTTSTRRIPPSIVAKAHEVGLMNLHLPESLGGPELSAFDGMLVGEELNWGCSGSAPRSARTGSRPARS
jgi:acyl-CoA dehydrogenase